MKGRTIGEIAGLFEKYRDLVTGKAGTDADIEELGKMAVFSGVSEFPVRVKCAILAWRTLQAALQEEGGSVTTE